MLRSSELLTPADGRWQLAEVTGQRDAWRTEAERLSVWAMMRE
jgi:hypothetical protein